MIGTRVIDLAGRTATPGLIDTHVHFSEPADALDLGDARSMDDVIAKVRARAATVPPGTWVRGGGWDEGKLKERRYITAADLDKAAPEHPVYLTHTTGHYGVANSLALKLSGVTRETKDPPGGTIDRDKDGNPTGVHEGTRDGTHSHAAAAVAAAARQHARERAAHHRGLQPRGDDRRERPERQPGEVGPLQAAARRREAERPRRGALARR